MPEPLALQEVTSPIGALRLAATSQGLVRIAFPRERGLGFRGWLERHLPEASPVDWVPVLDKVATELEEYFSGRRTVFTVPLDLRGTPFQRAVWEELLRVPYGEVRSYGEVARVLGRPSAARAVGAAVGSNPEASAAASRPSESFSHWSGRACPPDNCSKKGPFVEGQIRSRACSASAIRSSASSSPQA
jgi:O6-methylguanine-DNA--protein-cysteine methyltransferase